MSNEVYRISQYRFQSTDAVLFDANVWLYIYGPQREFSSRLRDIYSLALQRIRSAQIPIYIDVLILSEFINAYARFVYNELPQASKPADFKSFRNSPEFKQVGDNIGADCRRVLKKCRRTHLVFESVNLAPILRDVQAGTSDFNDQIIAELCRIQGLKLITHDADFKGEDLTIITANGRLLS